MAWLTRDEEVLAVLAVTRPRRWASDMEGAVLVRRPRLLHTLWEPAALDVAWCVEDGDALRVCFVAAPVAPRRVALPHLRCAVAVVASGGAFERWRLKVGDRLTVAETDSD